MTALAEVSRLDWPTHWGPAPRWATPRNPDRPSFGPAIGEIAAHLGQPLFPFQQFVQDVANEVDVDGSWFYDTVVILMPRRSGKTHQIKTLVAHRGTRWPILAAITAQTRDYAVKRWAELTNSVRDLGLWHTPLASQLHKPHVGTSKEKLMWRNGSVFYPFAPNAEANHGDAPDLIIVDELWAHSLGTKADIQQGYRPAWSVKPGQEWLLSAAGDARSLWLKQARRAGREAVADPTSRMAFFEWSVPPAEVEGLDGQALVDVVLNYHPRRDHGLRAGYLLSELHSEGMTRAGFLRAYANIDEDGDGQPMAIDEVLWRERRRLGVQPPAGVRVAIGVACDEHGRESTIAAAWEDPDTGRLVTHTVRGGPGVLWAGDYADALAAGTEVGVVVTTNTGHGRTIALVADGAGHAVHKAAAGDLAAAAIGWSQGVTDPGGMVVHDGSIELESSLRNAELGRSGGWVSRSGEPITGVMSHSMALWGLQRIPEPEPEPARFVIW